MKTYSVILLDIDRTLLDDNNQISDNTKRLLGRLEKRGIPVILCSAREPGSVEQIAREAGLSGPMVCFGGNLILGEDRSILEDRGIPAADALAFKKFADLHFPSISVGAYLYNVWLVDDLQNPYILDLVEINHTQPVMGSLEAAVASAPHVHKFLCSGKPQDLSRLQQEGEKRFPQLAFSRSGDIYLEVTIQGVSKGTALHRIQEYYQVDPEKIVAVGDSFVDLSMIQAAGLGIAMGNAPELVKQSADRVTATNQNEGVYIALKTLRFQPPKDKEGE